MKMQTTTLAILALACALSLTTTAVAQAQPTNNAAWHGQDSEFGSIRTPYAADMNGERAPIEAQVVLRKNYEESESRFFMFAFTVENTPLDVQFDSLVRVDTGQELPCYQRQGEARTAIKCFVDLKDMPPAGTEIKMKGTVGSTKAGAFQVGAIIVPFTYTWARVQMSNGLNAELYGYTIVNVATPTSGDSKAIAGIGNNVPGVGVLGVVAAGLVAVGLAARRPKQK